MCLQWFRGRHFADRQPVYGSLLRWCFVSRGIIADAKRSRFRGRRCLPVCDNICLPRKSSSILFKYIYSRLQTNVVREVFFQDGWLVCLPNSFYLWHYIWFSQMSGSGIVRPVCRSLVRPPALTPEIHIHTSMYCVEQANVPSSISYCPFRHRGLF